MIVCSLTELMKSEMLAESILLPAFRAARGIRRGKVSLQPLRSLSLQPHP